MRQPSSSDLPLRDTPERYGRVTRTLHWTIAALLAWQFTGMILKLLLDKHPVAEFARSTHNQVGLILFVLILARLLWALKMKASRPSHGTGFMGFAARAGHGALYLAMLMVPVAALLRAWGNDRAWGPFGFVIFPPKTPEVSWAVEFGHAVHGELAWVMLVLILGHIVMVGMHEHMWKDGTLARMLTRKPR